MSRFLITDFGAVADGKTDCTAAVQKALDKAGEVRGTVVVPSGRFLCGYVKVPPFVSLVGDFSWTFYNFAGSELVLCRDDVECMIDIKGAFGCRLDGLSINGNNKGDGINGVQLNWRDHMDERKSYNGREDTPTISNCRIGNFSGNAVHFNNVWCFSIRHSMLCYSENGLYLNGCDAFIQDNWFSVNRKAGVLSDRGFMSGTFGGNRFECNHREGAKFNNIGYVQFNNNYWDYNRGSGFLSYGTDDTFDYRGHISFVGNIFYRDGVYDGDYYAEDSIESSHILISDACNVIVSSNDFGMGENQADGRKGPYYGIVYKNLCNSIISGNTMMCAAVSENIKSLGGEKGQVIVKDNVGDCFNNEKCQAFPRYSDK